jgi:hypothetical protein
MGRSSDHDGGAGKKRRLQYRLSTDREAGIAFGALNCNATGAGGASGTSFKDNGAQKLTNVHVLLIFWGQQWAGNPNALATQVTANVTNLLAGPYMSYLVQYGVHRGSLWGTKFFTGGDPPNPFTTQSVGNFLINQLDNDNLPEPDSDWPIFYCVIMPTNVSYQGSKPPDPVLPLPPGTVSQVVGANSSIVWYDYDLGDVDNDPAHFAWIGNNGSANYITTVLSHELVETCTDPNGGNGIVQVSPPPQGNAAQIGDPCTQWCDFVRGVRVQAYWSQLDSVLPGLQSRGGCVLPKLYSLRRTLADRNISGRISSLGKPIPSLNRVITSLF